MANFRTQKCSKFGHPEILLHLADDAQMDPEWLIGFFENAVSTGGKFKPDDTVQIGWMIDKVQQNSEGDLEIWEPVFDSIPIKWVRGIDNTIRHLTLQKSVAELINMEPVFPSIIQAGTVVGKHLGELPELSISVKSLGPK